MGCGLPACIYLSPINAPPTIYGVTRACANDVSPCDFNDVHHGDDLTLRVSFIDPEHHEDEVSYEWSAEACDRTQNMCDPIDVRNARTAEPEVQVPLTLHDTTTPVEWVRVTIELRDDRGAHDTGGALIPIAEAP